MKKRRVLNVSPKTLERLKKIQAKMMLDNGHAPSLQELADKIIESDEIEKEIQTKIKFRMRFD